MKSKMSPLSCDQGPLFCVMFFFFFNKSHFLEHMFVKYYTCNNAFLRFSLLYVLSYRPDPDLGVSPTSFILLQNAGFVQF